MQPVKAVASASIVKNRFICSHSMSKYDQSWWIYSDYRIDKWLALLIYYGPTGVATTLILHNENNTLVFCSHFVVLAVVTFSFASPPIASFLLSAISV